MNDKRQAILNEVTDNTHQLEMIAMRQTATMTFWEVSVIGKQGEDEARYRAELHSLLDQILDQRARSLQLVKDWERL